jgi:hypothetical protein
MIHKRKAPALCSQLPGRKDSDEHQYDRSFSKTDS